MKKIDFEESRRIQYEMLKHLDDYCSSNSITYYLAGGTLLGAVRHSGYIPWDDDTDIFMPREDYEVFISKYKNNSLYSVYTFHTEDDYFYTFGRIKNNQTYNLRGNKKTAGICIDIYPIDGIPDNEDEIIPFFKEVSRLREKEVFLLRWYDRFYRYHLSFVNLIIKPILKNNANRLEKTITRYKFSESSKVSPLTDCNRRFPRTIFGKGQRLLFEDREFVVPDNYQEYLTEEYGDYMTLPPVDKRIPNHVGNYFYY